jgi:hypothetical protein
MYRARNKVDLMIEVWEKLDCESVGRSELIAIEKAVTQRFGPAAVESPMIIARLLADEGAVLRHAEVMNLYLERAANRPYEAAFRNVVKISGLDEAAASIRRLENLRRKYASEKDKEGLRLVREKAREARAAALENAKDKKLEPERRAVFAEIAEWLTLWAQSPDMFETWIGLRLGSEDFQRKFPEHSPPG